ncbi:MAG: pilus assembly protein N-terminal domain-containing protein [Tabrizicola sp.]|nr:pilus assembly protein N-terminal domain-containing protein [Tabrizicola sp.]
MTLVSGRQKLLAGHAQLLEFPSDFAEVSMSAPGLVDISVVSSRWLYVLGKAPGLAVLAWISEGEAGVLSINLCPFAADSPETELAAGAPADAELCQDADGAPMRLGVGQVVQIAFRDAAGKEMQITEATMAAPKIADLSVKDNKSAVVTGVGPGWTSLTLIDFDSQRAMTCEIIVE